MASFDGGRPYDTPLPSTLPEPTPASERADNWCMRVDYMLRELGDIEVSFDTDDEHWRDRLAFSMRRVRMSPFAVP